MTTPVKSEPWEVTRLGGDFPRLTSLNSNLQDSCNGKIFVYGGLDPGEQDDIPKPYLHVCDTLTMEFTDLTNSLVYRTPGDPYSSANIKQKCTPLPALTDPGTTFLSIRNHPMIFMFGGHDASDDVDAPSSRLIAIHTKHKEWSYVEFDNAGQRSPAPRINPVLVGCGNRLYIFGGFPEFGDNWKLHRTYSIIEFVEKSHKCIWVAIDVPYSKQVPAGQNFAKGVAVEGGSRILLFPGRRNCNDKIAFNHDNIFYFLPNTNSFQKANIKGELPKKIHWYHAYNFEPTGALKSVSPPSVFVATWTPYGRYLSPEIWRIYLHPKDELVVCLHLHKKVFDLDINFRRFYLVENSMYLMGQGGETSEEGSEDGSDAGAMCDTYVRIPV